MNPHGSEKMSEGTYSVALRNALTEIRNICPDVSYSFIFSTDGMIVAGDSEATEETMEKVVHSFQNTLERAEPIGGLQALLIDGEKGKVHLSRVNDMYLALAASKKADTTYLRTVMRVVIPTVLKLLEVATPTPLQSTPSQFAPSKQLELSKQLIVENLTGFFVGDSVQIDTETLTQWAEFLDLKTVDEVEIESLGGKMTKCSVKEMNDSKLKGKGIIRIPEKISKALGVKRGELVKVKPGGA